MTGAEAFGLAAVIVAFLAGPIGRAIARRIAGPGAVGGTTGEADAVRLAELEQRLLDAETVQRRIAEVEERLDFAERMLANPGPDRERALPARAADG